MPNQNFEVSKEELLSKIREADEKEKALNEEKKEISNMIKLYLGGANKEKLDDAVEIKRNPPKTQYKIDDKMVQEKIDENQDFKAFCLENLDIKLGKPSTSISEIKRASELLELDSEFSENFFSAKETKESFTYKVK